MRILIIDDEKNCLDDLLTALKPTNYEIEIETNPLKSFEKFKKQKYDVIISDVGMKELNGIELLKRLKEVDKSVRVIIMTAYGDLETARSSINNRAYAFFCKPVTINDLIYKLREIEAEITEEQEKHSKFIELSNENVILKEKYNEHIKMEEQLILSVQSEILNLYGEIETTQKEIVYRLSEVAEMRSKETGNHVRRVASFAEIFAIKYGLSKEESDILKQASPMHDIGKVAIPDNILNKKGSLTKEEFDIVKEHTTIGHQILGGSTRSILKVASIVSFEHHEKFDGTGYPRG
ncbi:MAG TPA: response regulator, partial [Spirochaetota bacterium]|nr:response regulator [Spirochaetota bacterium]